MTIDTIRHGDLPATGNTGANLIREAAAVMADAHALAKAVANTQMIPKHFQGKPDECAAAMLYGASLGLDPMQSVRQIYVVHGQAALYARAMVALVMGAGHEVWTVESTDDSVTVAGRRRGSDHAEQSTWTFDRAKRAGYTNNEKYRTDPQAMLYSKAASEVCRKIAPDVLSGVYAVEELQMERVESVRVDQPQRGLAALMPPEQTAPKDDPTAVGGMVGPDAAPLLNTSSALAKRMYASLADAGIAKENVHALYAEAIGRTVESSKELTEDEARQVIDHLANLPRAES